MPDNIVTAIALNEGIVRSKAPPEKRAIALAWLFHLVGDIHQPLHTVQLFTREYPQGDRGGNEICVRTAPGSATLGLHRLWDGLITSTNNIGQLRNIAIELISKFSKTPMREFEPWCRSAYRGKLNLDKARLPDRYSKWFDDLSEPSPEIG